MGGHVGRVHGYCTHGHCIRGHCIRLLPSAAASRTLHIAIASLTVPAPLRAADSVTLVWPEASSSVLEYGVWHGLLPTEPDQLKRYQTGTQNIGETLLEVGGLEPGSECMLPQLETLDYSAALWLRS